MNEKETKLVFKAFLAESLPLLVKDLNEFITENKITCYNEFQYNHMSDFYEGVLSYYI